MNASVKLRISRMEHKRVYLCARGLCCLPRENATAKIKWRLAAAWRRCARRNRRAGIRWQAFFFGQRRKLENRGLIVRAISKLKRRDFESCQRLTGVSWYWLAKEWQKANVVWCIMVRLCNRHPEEKLPRGSHPGARGRWGRPRRFFKVGRLTFGFVYKKRVPTEGRNKNHVTSHKRKAGGNILSISGTHCGSLDVARSS